MARRKAQPGHTAWGAVRWPLHDREVTVPAPSPQALEKRPEAMTTHFRESLHRAHHPPRQGEEGHLERRSHMVLVLGTSRQAAPRLGHEITRWMEEDGLQTDTWRVGAPSLPRVPGLCRTG